MSKKEQNGLRGLFVRPEGDDEFEYDYDGDGEDHDGANGALNKLPDEVPESAIATYHQACSLMETIPRASGALARCCLQIIIRDYWRLGTNDESTLAEEIDKVRKRLSDETLASIDYVRKFGAIDYQLSQHRDMMVETTDEEAKLLISLFCLLIEDWYVERGRRETRLATMKGLVDKSTKTSLVPSKGEAAGKPGSDDGGSTGAPNGKDTSRKDRKAGAVVTSEIAE